MLSRFWQLARFAIPAFLVAVLVAAPFYRALLVEDAYGDVIRCQGCFFWQVVRADGPVLLLAAALLLLAHYFRSAFVSLVLRVGFLALGLAYLFDMYVFEAFNNRLYVSDIGQYFSPRLVTSFTNSYLFAAPGLQLLAAVSVLVCVGFVTLRTSRWTAVFGTLLGVVAVTLLLWYLLAPRGAYVHGWVIESLFERNRATGTKTPLSDERIAHYLSRDDATGEMTCAAGMNASPNIILLIVESWSSWQSQHFSGLENWTPGLDAIAAENLYSKHFYSNGYKTKEGLIAFFTGLQPMPGMGPSDRQRPFRDFESIDRTLPKLLAQNGYQSLFMTSGTLDFSKKHAWLDNIGFDYYEGHDHPGYIGQPRFTFSAVADAVLYSRILEMLTGDGQKERFRDLWPGGLPEVSEASVLERQRKNALYRDFPRELDVYQQIRDAGPGYTRHTGELIVEEESITLAVDHGDPYFKFPELALAGDRDYELKVRLRVPLASTAQLFFKSGEDARFNERFSVATLLEAGDNTITLPFAIGEAPGSIRFDPGYQPGRYTFTEMTLTSRPRRPALPDGADSPLQPDKPYFMAIETVSTHQPYIDPMTFEKSMKGPFVYADKTATAFYEALVDSGFFNDGVLVITSDHRSMNPLTVPESDLFGLSAPGRIPFVVVAPEYGLRGEIPGAFQQRDMINSLLHLVSDRVCTAEHEGNMLAQTPVPPRCIMHHRGDRRSNVDVFCGDEEGTILLDADDTRVIVGDEEALGPMVEVINRQRVESYVRDGRWQRD